MKTGTPIAKTAKKAVAKKPVAKKATTYTFKKFVKQLEKICNPTVDGKPDKSTASSCLKSIGKNTRAKPINTSAPMIRCLSLLSEVAISASFESVP